MKNDSFHSPIACQWSVLASHVTNEKEHRSKYKALYQQHLISYFLFFYFNLLYKISQLVVSICTTSIKNIDKKSIFQFSQRLYVGGDFLSRAMAISLKKEFAAIMVVQNILTYGHLRLVMLYF